jgi:hypothetical protein
MQPAGYKRGFLPQKSTGKKPEITIRKPGMQEI